MGEPRPTRLLVWCLLVSALVACTDTAPATSPPPTGLPGTTAASTTAAASSTVPTSTEPTPTTIATSTTVPASTTTLITSTTSPSTGDECPDLFRDDGPDSEFHDVVLAAWNRATGEPLWEIPLGTRLPHWGASGDGIVLGFPDGALVGIEAASCDYWSITIAGGIDDLNVLESGAYIASSGSQLAGFSGRGQGIWRFDGGDSEYRYVADNAGVAVFIDRFGDLLGLTAGGEQAFTWGGVANSTSVAVGETYLFRSTGAEVAARPVGGGGLLWTTDLPAVDSLLSVPGTLLAAGGGMLYALEPPTGEVRWSMAFDREISAPAVLDHGELHLAVGDDGLGHMVLHLDPADGQVVLAGNAPAGYEWFPEMDDALVLEVGEADAPVRGIDMRTREVFAVVTGANRVDRFTQVELASGAVVLTLTFSGERF